MLLLLPMLLFGCVEQWCTRFNLQCESSDLDVPEVVDRDLDGWAEDDDCDDLNYNINPSAPEVCNRLDDDCDGESDEGMPTYTRWYYDNDDDSYGGAELIEGCVDQPEGMTDNSDDCYDYDAAVSPDATEVCNGIDDNCDGLIDDDDPAVDLATAVDWYPDDDVDGYADADAKEPVISCAAPVEGSWTTSLGDCDDGDPDANPSMREVCGNGIDDDCDGDVGGPGLCLDLTTDDASGSVYKPPASNLFGAAVLALPGGAGNATLVITGAAGRGAVYVGTPALDDRTTAATMGVTWAGDENSHAGTAIAILQDHFGPLAPALLIGAPGVEGSGETDGWVYLLADPSDGGGVLSSVAIGVDGSATGGVIGGQIAAADLDDDGVMDAAVTALSSEPEVAAVWIWSGTDTSQSGFDGSARVWSSAAGGSIGRSSAARDMDGDGVDDLLTTVVFDVASDPTGRIVLVAGPIVGDRSVDDADWWSDALPAGSTITAQLLAGGDSDGDGHADLFVTAEAFEESANGALIVYVDAGTTQGASSGPAAVRMGGSSEARIGMAAGFLPDADGDGSDELVVGFPDLGPGAISLLYGPLSGIESIESGDVMVRGSVDYGGFGTSLSAAIDLDGDGDLDLVGGQLPSAAKAPDEEEELFFFLLDY